MQGEQEGKLTIDKLIDSIKIANKDADINLIRRSYDLANEAHKGQKRASGEAYIIHPLNVAKILVDLHLDEKAISAALLHDVVEDTLYTIEEMEECFGSEIALLIDGVTKLGKIEYKSKEEQQLENYRKLFMAMAQDIRVILIKLADRLHNMRTLKYVREEKQKRIAKETLEIYAPLANRLGIFSIKWELEDLCLRYLEPVTYYNLVESVKQKRQERQEFISLATKKLEKELTKNQIKSEIRGRAKHFYSIYKKMKRDQKDINEIYDLSALRVLVHSVRDCYEVLGIIHTIWKPLPGRFKDYIAMPKSNGYQSLHTTVMTDGYPLEIQIRTFSMHYVSEYGVAAHWRYKESGKSVDAKGEFEQKMSWLRQLVALQKEVDDPREYVEALKVDIFSDEVFVFTPKGDVVGLPKGSITLDFAYHIHTEVGHHCVGAKVNGRLVPLEYKLQNGDIVSIITNKSNDGPSLDWINIVASSDTRNKIRSWFKKVRREDNIARGNALLEKEAQHLGYNTKELLQDNRLKKVAEKLNIQTEDDLLASLGYGGLTIGTVMAKLIELHKEVLQKTPPPDLSELLHDLKPKNSKKKAVGSGILVEGERGVLVRLAKCCNPIPGDDIVGYVTRGRGVSVHLATCPNVLHEESDLSRVIEVNWELGINKLYNVELEISANDQSGILTSLIAIPSDMHINISSIHANANPKNKTSTILMGLEVKNVRQVREVMSKMRKIHDVYEVKRSLMYGKERN